MLHFPITECEDRSTSPLPYCKYGGIVGTIAYMSRNYHKLSSIKTYDLLQQLGQGGYGIVYAGMLRERE